MCWQLGDLKKETWAEKISFSWKEYFTIDQIKLGFTDIPEKGFLIFMRVGLA